MRDLDAVKSLAWGALEQSCLGAQARFLWGRAERLAQNSDLICQLPDIVDREIQVDRFCLLCSAYFSQVGLARYMDFTGMDSAAIGAQSDADIIGDYCARAVEEKLSELLTRTQVERVCDTIIESSRRFTSRIEAIILSDARNLDDMGAIGLINEFQQLFRNNKGTSEMLTIWQRKMDYRYWEARLKESFRFESVRNIAEMRLRAAEQFMSQLKVESSGRDMENLTGSVNGSSGVTHVQSEVAD